MLNGDIRLRLAAHRDNSPVDGETMIRSAGAKVSKKKIGGRDSGNAIPCDAVAVGDERCCRGGAQQAQHVATGRALKTARAGVFYTQIWYLGSR